MVENLIRNEEKTKIIKHIKTFKSWSPGQASEVTWTSLKRCQAPAMRKRCWSPHYRSNVLGQHLCHLLGQHLCHLICQHLCRHLCHLLCHYLCRLFCDHACNQHYHLWYQVLAYTVSQLSISPENTIFHFLHLDVGEVYSFSKPRKFCFTFFSPPSPIHIILGCVSGSIGPTFRPLSHPSTRQLQVPSIPIAMISNHHHHESAGRPVRSSIAASRWRYAAKNWFDKL